MWSVYQFGEATICHGRLKKADMKWGHSRVPAAVPATINFRSIPVIRFPLLIIIEVHNNPGATQLPALNPALGQQFPDPSIGYP